MKEIHECELVEARIASVPALVRNRDQATSRCDLRSPGPQRADLDPVDSVTPRIPLGQLRFAQPVLQLQFMELTASKLEAHCAERIPRYMVPGIVEFRTALPKTSTGKADKTLIVREHLATAKT